MRSLYQSVSLKKANQKWHEKETRNNTHHNCYDHAPVFSPEGFEPVFETAAKGFLSSVMHY